MDSSNENSDYIGQVNIHLMRKRCVEETVMLNEILELSLPLVENRRENEK